MSRDQIREIARIVGKDNTYKHFFRRINKEFEVADEERNANIYVLYAEDGDEKIGFCVIGYSPTKMRTWERIFKEEGWVANNFSINTKTSFELMYMYVKPEYRRQGHGKELFTKAIGFTKEKGAKEIYAYVGNKDNSALMFYQKQKAITIRDFSDQDESAAFLMWEV